MFSSLAHQQLAKATFLNKFVQPAAAQIRQFSVAYNVKSRFQQAYEAKMAAQAKAGGAKV